MIAVDFALKIAAFPLWPKFLSDERCGNGIPDIAETCDDGNTEAGDGCSDKCKNENCGDSIYSPADDEECDTGSDTQACNGAAGSCTLPTCRHCTIPGCGDGYTNKAFTPFMATAVEECDEAEIDITTDPPTIKSIDSQTCNGNNHGLETIGSCRVPSCGDGYKNPNFKPPGDLAHFEECDTRGDSESCNGNNNENDANKKGVGDCAKPYCGDGYLNPKFTPDGVNPEQCDDGITGNTSDQIDNQDFCLTGPGGNCRIARCGDGITRTASDLDRPTEECDDGNSNNDDLCVNIPKDDPNGVCKHAACGDGYTRTATDSDHPVAEECDDGNHNDDDGCPDGEDGTCRHAICGDGFKNTVAGEVCDPGGRGRPPIGCVLPSVCSNDCKVCI